MQKVLACIRRYEIFRYKLVERLIQHKADVTIVTRGLKEDSFGDAVKRLQVDRTDSEVLRTVLDT